MLFNSEVKIRNLKWRIQYSPCQNERKMQIINFQLNLYIKTTIFDGVLSDFEVRNSK